MKLAKVDVQKYDLTTEEGNTSLTKAVLAYDQAECPVIHRFGPGLYIREIFIPKGTFAIGHVHKFEHLNIFLKGKVQIVHEDGSTSILEAPAMFVSQPGRKVGLMLEDVLWQNIYATTETDIEKLEEMFFDKPDYFKEMLALKLKEDFLKHEEDRQDYKDLLVEIGYTEEEVKAQASITTDRIFFPDASGVVIGNSPIEGKGLFASGSFKKGSIIAPGRLNGKRTPAGYITNHAKVPNAKVVTNDKGDIYLVALKDISGMSGGQLGEEITLDYRQVLSINLHLKRKE